MGHNLRLSGSAAGNRNTGPINMGGGSNLVERDVFASNSPTLPFSQWYVPGNGSPALSASDYLNTMGFYWSRPYDLDTMGSEGAAIKAREGYRYAWVICCDHGGNFPGTNDLFVGYSHDPQSLPEPTTMVRLFAVGTEVNIVDQNGLTQNSLRVYQTPHLVYNPDSNAINTDKFWIYMEGVSAATGHELCLLTTPDLTVDSVTLIGPAIPTVPNGWSSYGKPKRLGVNNWVCWTQGKPDATPVTVGYYKYTSTDGWTWTSTFSPNAFYINDVVTISGQDWMVGKEIRTDNDYLALFSVDSDRVYTGTTNRISTGFGPSGLIGGTFGALLSYPSPTYFQDIDNFLEDGVLTIYAQRGFPPSGHDYSIAGPFKGYDGNFSIMGSITSNVLTVNSVVAGTPIYEIGMRVKGAPGSWLISSINPSGPNTYGLSGGGTLSSQQFQVHTQGGLWNQHIDIYRVITDPTAAANAAPLGVKAKCAAGTVTVSWNDVLPNNTYRVYRGTTAGTQSTLIGTISKNSITDTPTPGAQYFYKVVTMNSGVEQKNRVIPVYCSNNEELFNRHFNRVILDGGDTTKINTTFLAAACSWLTSNDCWKYVNWWVDARFGIKTDGSGFISKIYCLGTTWLPRGGDYTPTTSNTFPSTSSNTSYSATSFRGTTPSWVNNASSAHGYFGNGRPANIQRWTELTLLAAYQKPGTTAAGLFGWGEFDGFYLRHESGSTGNISFAMSEFFGGANPYTTATVPFSTATAAHVAAGVFDGTSLTAYLDGTPGSVQSVPNFANYDMKKKTPLLGSYTDPLVVGGLVIASLGSGCTSSVKKPNYAMSNEALFTGAGLAVFNKGLPQSLIQSWGALYA